MAKSRDAVGRRINREAGKEAPAGSDDGDGARTPESSSGGRDEGTHVAGIRGITLGALQWEDIDWDAKTITFGKSFWRGRLQDSTKTGQEHVRHMPESLERVLAKHLEACKNIGPDDFVFCRSDDDPRPPEPDDLRREVLYPLLDRCGSKGTPRADGFHAFRRAASKYLRRAVGLELAAEQLAHKRMTTTDEHYNERDMDDLKKASKERSGRVLPPIADFAPDFFEGPE